MTIIEKIYLLLLSNRQTLSTLKTQDMSQWDFTVVGGSLVKTLVSPEDYVAPRSKSYTAPKFDMAANKITIFEQGKYDSTILFHEFNEINGVAPTDLQDAYTKLLGVVPTNVGGGSYNTVTAYDTAGDLPITFATQTIHSISILCITGTLTVTISGEETTMVAGQKTDMEADTLLEEAIVINSTTGTFLVTTIS